MPDPRTPLLPPLPRKPPGRGTVLFVVLLILAPSACSESETSREERGIPRESFVRTYVGLRVAALRSPEAEITVERRDSVLRAHGVTQEELLEFVEIHGRDVDFMSSVWDSIEARLVRESDEARLREREDTLTAAPSDTTPGDDAAP